MSAPRFSVITVCLNAGNALLETVDGSLRQDHDDFEIVVQDGGSDDGSVDALPEDSRIRVFREPDEGIYDAMNRAARRAAGTYIGFLNAGDRFPEDTVLSEVDRAIVSAGEPDLVYGDAFDERSAKRRRAVGKLTRRSLYLDGVCHQSQWIRRETFLELGGFDDRYRFRADQELLLRLVEAEKTTAHLPRVIALYDGRGFSARSENRRALDREWADLRRNRYSSLERLRFGIASAFRLLWLKRLLLDVIVRLAPRLLEKRRARHARGA